MTAENRCEAFARLTMAACFNEAAADDRGKQTRGAIHAAEMRRFNEAAADDRGKHTMHLQNRSRAQRRASMRPRPMTAENMLYFPP